MKAAITLLVAVASGVFLAMQPDAVPDPCDKVADMGVAARDARARGVTMDQLMDDVRKQQAFRLAWVVKRAWESDLSTPAFVFRVEVLQECRQRREGAK